MPRSLFAGAPARFDVAQRRHLREPYPQMDQTGDLTMPALSEPQLPTQQPAADTTACWDAANKRALHLLFGAQRIMVGEMAFAFEDVPPDSHRNPSVRRIRREIGRVAFGSRLECDGRGMQPASTRIPAPRLRSPAQARRTPGRSDLKPARQSRVTPKPRIDIFNRLNSPTGEARSSTCPTHDRAGSV